MDARSMNAEVILEKDIFEKSVQVRSVSIRRTHEIHAFAGANAEWVTQPSVVCGETYTWKPTMSNALHEQSENGLQPAVSSDAQHLISSQSIHAF